MSFWHWDSRNASKWAVKLSRKTNRIGSFVASIVLDQPYMFCSEHTIPRGSDQI